MYHTEVVDSSGRNKLIMDTYETSRSHIIEVKVEIEDVTLLHTKF